MSVAGSEWPQVALADLLREPLRNGHSAKASGTGEGVPTLTLSAVTYNDFSERNVKLTVADPSKVGDLWLKREDILVERANTAELVGTAALFPGPDGLAIFPDLMIRVRLRSDVSARFVVNFLRSPRARRYFQSRAQGIAGSMPKIDQTTVEQVPVPLPSRAEQDRVVAEIDKQLTRIDAGVAALERVQANLKRYRASVLKAAVEGRLVPTEAELARKERRDYEPASKLLARILKKRRARWEAEELAKLKAKGRAPTDDRWKAKYKEPEPADTSELPELPEGWCWATVEQISELVTSGSRNWAERYAEAGALFIRAQDIKTDKLVMLDVARVSVDETTEGARTRVRQGDLLVTITGANVTKSALVCEALEEAYVSQHVALVRLVVPAIASYVHTWVTCPSHGRRILEAAAYGAGKPGLNLENVRRLPVALPPLGEQPRIGDRVAWLDGAADRLASESRSNLAKADGLRRSVLRAAFEGKLVPPVREADDVPVRTGLKANGSGCSASSVQPKGRRASLPLREEDAP